MKKLLTIIFIGVLSFAGSRAVSLSQGMPIPYVMDECSYLLAADTFAHGRLTNPAHPMWQHFETFHVLQKPTYMSKYPPAQGFFMAVGQVLFGHPAYGVWLSSALMSMSICWMLYAWVPAFWAFIGGLISILEFGMFTYWSQSYWGGAVAALGGALVFGALPRILKDQRLRDVVWLGLGLALLINSRPLEGLLLGIPLGCLVLPWRIKWASVNNGHFVKSIILPFILILSIIIIGVGGYNKAVTGKASVFPYVAYLKEYMVTPIFIWEPLRPMPAFRHQEFACLEREASSAYYSFKRTWKGFWELQSRAIERISGFYFGYILAIPILCFLPRFFRDGRRALKFFLAFLIIFAAFASMPWRGEAHYISCITCLVVLLIVMGLRSLVLLNNRRAMMLVSVLIFLQVFSNIVLLVKPFHMESFGTLQGDQGLFHQEYSREALRSLLTQKGGKYLVLVKCLPGKFFYSDWVYNSADIDQQSIVWARSMGPQNDARLIEYFKDRQIWRITVDKEFPPEIRDAFPYRR